MKSFTSILKDSKASNHNTWVCSLCYPFALEIGKIYGCGSLIYMANHPMDTLAPTEYGEGKFALLKGQGHRDDETIIFEEKPYYGVEVEFKLLDVRPRNIKVSIDDVIDLHDMAVEHGGYNYDKQGSFECFLIQKLHQLIVRWEKKNGNLETFYKNFVKEREVYLKKKRETENVRKQNE